MAHAYLLLIVADALHPVRIVGPLQLLVEGEHLWALRQVHQEQTMDVGVLGCLPRRHAPVLQLLPFLGVHQLADQSEHSP